MVRPPRVLQQRLRPVPECLFDLWDVSSEYNLSLPTSQPSETSKRSNKHSGTGLKGCYKTRGGSSVLWLASVTSLVIHTHTFNGPFSGTTRVSRYQKGKTNLDFIGARDSEWQWQQLGHMQVCTSLQTDNHASTPPLSFLQAGCPSCRPTNSVKALKAHHVSDTCTI